MPDIKILILGDDGFCTWPTSLHLSALGREVTIVDNLSRRNVDNELERESLTPSRPIGERLRVWKEVSGREIALHNFNVTLNYQRLLDVLKDWRPHAIVHCAEQLAAPYSVKSAGQNFARRLLPGRFAVSGLWRLSQLKAACQLGLAMCPRPVIEF